MRAYLIVCLPLGLLITSGVMWCSVIWTPYDWLNKFYSCYMAILVSIIDGHGLRIDMHHEKYPNKSMLALYKPLIHCNSHYKQLCLSNEMELFSYKGGCGVCKV